MSFRTGWVANPGAEARLHLLRANRDAISVMLGKAAAGGLDLDEAVVIVADQRDAVGRELAEAAAETAGLDAAEETERAAGRSEIPTAILVINVKAARALFAQSHPTVAGGLSRWPAWGCLRAVIIAEGSAMLVHAQISVSAGLSAPDTN